jgi:curved DNA-binding protein CbpA
MLQEYYHLLGLEPGATVDEIKHAYRLKAKLYHPDTSPVPEAHFQFIRIKEAADILMKVKSVQQYRTVNKSATVYHSRDPYFRTSGHPFSYRHKDTSSKVSGKKAEWNDFLSKKPVRTLYLLVHVLFIATGLLVFAGPIYNFILHGFDPYQSLFDSIFAMIAAMAFGLIMVYKISGSFIHFIRNGN